MRLEIFILCLFLVTCSSNSDNIHKIVTNGTTIIGRKLFTLFENKPFAAFWKIPYSEPPVGQLRFKVRYLST